ncbi:MAG: hypothetical protein WBP45_11885, partial [Daejeonella sp.]
SVYYRNGYRFKLQRELDSNDLPYTEQDINSVGGGGFHATPFITLQYPDISMDGAINHASSYYSWSAAAADHNGKAMHFPEPKLFQIKNKNQEDPPNNNTGNNNNGDGNNNGGNNNGNIACNDVIELPDFDFYQQGKLTLELHLYSNCVPDDGAPMEWCVNISNCESQIFGGVNYSMHGYDSFGYDKIPKWPKGTIHGYFKVVSYLGSWDPTGPLEYVQVIMNGQVIGYQEVSNLHYEAGKTICPFSFELQ